MKKFLFLLCAFLLVLGIAGSASAIPVQFAGNGHYYEVMTTKPNGANFNSFWSTALIYSDDYSYLGETSYFATVTSQAENDFIAGLVAGVGEKSWLGATDRLSEGNWIWAATGEAVTYINWASGEPNNAGWFGEHYLEMYTNGLWNDAGGLEWKGAYVVEFNGKASVPEPSTMLLLGVGLLGLAGAGRKKFFKK